jgi:hypothetical protein
MAHGYWTVLVPYVPAEVRTVWHPTQSDGPFAVLSRGYHGSELSAIRWAAEHLKGTPYQTKYIADEGD